MQIPSQGRCELNCADSRAVTKRGLFDCEPAHTADWMVQCDKTTFCAVDEECEVQYTDLLSLMAICERK